MLHSSAVDEMRPSPAYVRLSVLLDAGHDCELGRVLAPLGTDILEMLSGRTGIVGRLVPFHSIHIQLTAPHLRWKPPAGQNLADRRRQLWARAGSRSRFLLHSRSHPIGSTLGEGHDGHHRVGSQGRRTRASVPDPYALHVIEFAVCFGDADRRVLAHSASAELMS